MVRHDCRDVGRPIYEQKRQAWPEVTREEHVVQRKGVVYRQGHPIIPAQRHVDKGAEHHPNAANHCSDPVEPVDERGKPRANVPTLLMGCLTFLDGANRCCM